MATVQEYPNVLVYSCLKAVFRLTHWFQINKFRLKNASASAQENSSSSYFGKFSEWIMVVESVFNYQDS